MDSNYETNTQPPVRRDGQPDSGYSYWADGQGWQQQQPPRTGATPARPDASRGPSFTPPTPTSAAGDAFGGFDHGSADATRAVYGGSADSTSVMRGGSGSGNTSFYGGAGRGGETARQGAAAGFGGLTASIGRMTGGFTGGNLGTSISTGISRMTGGWAGGNGGRGGNGGGGMPFGIGGGAGGPRGPRARGKGDWWRYWTLKKAGLVAGGVVGAFVLISFGGYEIGYSSTQIPAELASATQQSSKVYYNDGKTEIGTIGTTNRQALTLQQMGAAANPTGPSNDGDLVNAYLAIEDKGFWTEGGVSPTGILRATLHDAASGGSDLNGGSTITQEYVRNAFGLGLQQTASRKIKEIFISEKLAATESKPTILAGFLNSVIEGDNAFGVQAAAQTYFGKNAGQLSLAQDAVLASMPQAPSLLPEESDKSGLTIRWTQVLTNMYKDGFITQAQEQSALKGGLPTLLTWADPARANNAANINPANPKEAWEPYVLSQVEQEITSQDGGPTAEQLSTGGYKIVTTISKSMEMDMYNSVTNTITPNGIANAGGATVSSLPPWALVGAEMQDPKTGAVVAEFPGKGQNVTAAQCDGVCADNTVTGTREQVGSSFKPYVLSTAVSKGMNVQSSILNTSPYMCIAPDLSSSVSTPITQGEYLADTKANSCMAQGLTGAAPVQNDATNSVAETIGKQLGQAGSGVNQGAPVYEDTTQDALAQSSNTAFTDLTHKVGTQDVINMAQQFGVNTKDTGMVKGEVGIALGIGDLTVQEQDTMLATLADNGTYHSPHIVQYWQASGPGQAKQMSKVTTRQVLTAQQAGDVQYAMEMTNIDGTAAATATFGQNAVGTVISKTGTTSSEKSGFFIGATSQYALAVGMFTKTPASPDNLAELGGGGFGGFWPAKVWNAMAGQTFNTQPQTFPTTPDTTGQQQWNLIGQVNLNCNQQNGKHGKNNNPFANLFGGSNQNCPTASPSATPGATNNQFNLNGQNGNAATTGPQTGTVTCDPTVDQSCTQNADGTFTCDPTTDVDCTVTGTAAATTPAANAGNGGANNGQPVNAPATAGGVLFLPGTLLLGGSSLRRRRKNRRNRAQ